MARPREEASHPILSATHFPHHPVAALLCALRARLGNIARPLQIYVFDHSQAVVRDAWLGVLRQAKATGWIDGCFIDRGNTNATTGQGGSAHWDLTPEQKAAWDAGHARLLAASGALFAEGVVMANNQNYPGVNGRMYESFGNDFQGVGTAALAAAASGLRAPGHLAAAPHALGPASRRCRVLL